MSLQGITVAISPSGIQYFTQVLLADQVAKALQGLSPPDKTIDVGDILLSSNKGVSNWAKGITVHLSSGSMGSFEPKLRSITQQDGGRFTLTMVANDFQAKYSWNETFEYETCYFSCHSQGHQNNTYGYSVGFSKMVITIVFDFAFSNGEWTFSFVSATPTTSGVSPNIPSKSIVNSEEYAGCFKTQVSQATEDAVDTIDFSGPIQALIKPLFRSIPSTGQLTPDIVFEFPVGPSGLTFPNDAGIATGVTGDVTYKGTAYPGSDPPQLSLPPIPADNHLRYYASDYTFNALMWAFFEEGSLVATATPGNIPDPAALNTASYKNTPLQPLYDAYRDKPMTADIKALQAPTVEFQQIYDLTAASIGKLQSQLPADVYHKLQVLKGQVFMDETPFVDALVNALGQADADQYKTVIEGVAKVVGAVVSHSDQVVLNVVDDGKTIPVITFDVSQTDVLQDFVLGVSGTTQTLQFAFQIVTDLTTTKFVSSTIPGIDSGDFGTIWNWVLQPVFGTEVEKIGQAGVALPRIKGFDFLFEKATVTLEQGYAAVLADVQYVSDDGVLYLLSKRLVELDQEEEWTPTYAEELRRA